MSSPGKDFHIDAVYPEHLSRLRRGSPKADLPTSASFRRSARKQQRKGNSGRFRTQPVTFHEIKEVDEENLVEGEELVGPTGPRPTIGTISKSESDLKLQFELFYKSITRGDSAAAGETIDTNEVKGSLIPSAIFKRSSDDSSLVDQSSSSSIATTPVGFNTRSRPSL